MSANNALPTPPPTQPEADAEFMVVEAEDAMPPAPAAPAATPETAMPAAPAAPAAMPTPCKITLTTEKGAVASDGNPTLLGLCSIKAPEAPIGRGRPPMDLVACVDRSGSMYGDKMTLMKQTLQLLVERGGLTATDRFGLVSFDSTVKQEIPLRPLDASGKAQAGAVISRLAPGSTTNLSGGLLQSVDMIVNGAPAAEDKLTDGLRTTAVLLFTDGLANNGITETPPLLASLQGALHNRSGEQSEGSASAACSPVNVFTFGFGKDHNEDMLRAVADATGAQYYFIHKEDDIPTAFADCVGGLLSIVAQNASLKLEPTNGTSIGKLHVGSYKHSPSTSSPNATTIELGDLYSEDEKDLLFEFSLPTLAAPLGQPQPVIMATLRYFDCAANRFHEVTLHVAIDRPAETPVSQPVNALIDQHRNRIYVADAMERASQMADRGQVDGGRQILSEAVEMLRGTATRELSLTSGLIGELEALQLQYVDVARYHSTGSKMSKMSAQSHYAQRTNHMSAPSSTYTAGKSSKAARVAAFTSK